MPHIKPTIKQRRFVKRYLETGNQSQAIREVYNAKPGNVRSMATQVFKSPNVQLLLQEAYKKEGLTPDQHARDLSDLRKQSKPIGKINNPDFFLKVLQEESKMMGWYAAEKKQVDKRTLSLKADYKDKSVTDMMDELQKVKAEISSFTEMMKKENVKSDVL